MRRLIKSYTAAAMLTGLTDYWISFTTPPFRTTPRNLANNIKNFYCTDQAQGGGSYVRTGGDTRVLWNVVDGYYFNRPAPACEAQPQGESQGGLKKWEGAIPCTETQSSQASEKETRTATGTIVASSKASVKLSEESRTNVVSISYTAMGSSMKPNPTVQTAASTPASQSLATTSVSHTVATTTVAKTGPCICDGSGCSPKSPDYCANGTCPTVTPAPTITPCTYL